MRFEAHITCPIENAVAVETVPARIERRDFPQFKFSKIDGDAMLGNKPFCYLTTVTDDYNRMFHACFAVCKYLRDELDVRIIRVKIEEILVDTKTHFGTSMSTTEDMDAFRAFINR